MKYMIAIIIAIVASGTIWVWAIAGIEMGLFTLAISIAGLALGFRKR